MHSGYMALTEKEREALRLLLDGHDAKSIARHLGLSVHTIHERLREARRKMSTSSSREAARLLREIEGRPPEWLGDTIMGDVAVPCPAVALQQPDGTRGDWRRTGWIAGVLAMTISLAVLALLAQSGQTSRLNFGQSVGTLASAPAAVAPDPESKAAASEAALQFLEKLDREDWAGSWKATHKSFQLLNTVEWWTETSRIVRRSLGTPMSREPAITDFTAAPPNGF
jgi:DNA-binding CsgD family transcriptional regulator